VSAWKPLDFLGAPGGGAAHLLNSNEAVTLAVTWFYGVLFGHLTLINQINQNGTQAMCGKGYRLFVCWFE